MKLAFLAAQFPSLTTTFIFREWVYLQQDEDIDVHVFSLRRPKGVWKRKVPERLDLNVSYIRPDKFPGMIICILLFPILHPVRFWGVVKLFIKELMKIAPEQHGSYVFRMFAGVYLGRHLMRNNFDAIHGHFSAASDISFFAHLASGIPFSFTLYASDDLFVAPLPFFDEKIRQCRLVTTDTEYNERQINLLSEYRAKDKLHVIYTGADLEEFVGEEKSRSSDQKLKLLSIGSMTGVKGFITTVEALSHVRNNSVLFEYHIVGGGVEWERTLIQEMIQDYGLEKDIHLLGPQPFDAVHKELQWCDVFIMASEIQWGGRRDGLPTVIVEAMLLKRLVISTYISDIPNIISDKENGLIVPEKSPEQLASAIVYAFEHPDECQKMAKNAHLMAMKKFDANVNYKKLASLLKEGAVV